MVKFALPSDILNSAALAGLTLVGDNGTLTLDEIWLVVDEFDLDEPVLELGLELDDLAGHIVIVRR